IQTRKETELSKKEEFEIAERLRLEELRRSFDRQRRQDTRRLKKQAETQLRQLKIRQLEASEEATRQAEAREAHLETIRAKVRPMVLANPIRVLADTKLLIAVHYNYHGALV
ncbi:hypothetical protein ACTXT7_009892, partial [Hymenolepis weldensis]